MLKSFALSIVAAVVAAGQAYADWKPLLSPADLAELLADEPVILDIRGPAAYAEGHVEGAVSVPYNAWRGPESNPGALISTDKLNAILTDAGVEPDVPVVIAYQGQGTLDFGSAARVYWTLKSAGMDRIAILNGGLNAWRNAGHALSTDSYSNFPSDHEFSFSENWLIERDGVRDVLAGTRPAVMLDARPGDFFSGAARHDRAAWAGTLSGALNLVHDSWFGGPLLSTTRQDVLAVLEVSGVDPSTTEIVSFCNTGHWAATNWFVLSEIAGIEDVKLYPESMVGWTQNAERMASVVE